MKAEERASDLAARHAWDSRQRKEIEKDALEEVRQAEAAARAEEREACAKVVETDAMNWDGSAQYALETIAQAIRARND